MLLDFLQCGATSFQLIKAPFESEIEKPEEQCSDGKSSRYHMYHARFPLQRFAGQRNPCLNKRVFTPLLCNGDMPLPCGKSTVVPDEDLH